MRFTTRENFLDFIEGKFTYVGASSDIYNLEKLSGFKENFYKKDAKVLRRTTVLYKLAVQGSTCWLFKVNRDVIGDFLYVPIVGAKFFVASTPRCRCLHIWCPKYGRVYSFATRKKNVKVPPTPIKKQEEVEKEIKKRRRKRGR